MDKKTLEALKASIAKWEVIASTGDLSTVRLGPRECPLCEIHNNAKTNAGGTKCVECPVMKRTGIVACNGTPYADAEDALSQWRYSVASDAGEGKIHRYATDFKDAATAELEFLKSLLPNEVGDDMTTLKQLDEAATQGVDISKEAVEKLAQDCHHLIEVMKDEFPTGQAVFTDCAYVLRAQTARIAELEAALDTPNRHAYKVGVAAGKTTARNDALREADEVKTAALYAKNRLELIASDSWSGDGRDLKRSIQGVFAEFSALMTQEDKTDV